MKLYNRSFTRRELEARVGRIEQVGGIRRMRLNGGPEDGVEIIQVRTGGGLAFHVSPARGMDISLATLGDIPISWQSLNGDVHPAYYDPRGRGWLRTAAGGLLMTCGFTQGSTAPTDDGLQVGMHGRSHHTPASQVNAGGIWDGDEYLMSVSGIVEESVMFGYHIRLSREIRSSLGTNALEIVDHCENAGFQPAPLTLLYHFNFGFPLLMRESTFSFPSQRVDPREAETPLEGHDRWQPPDPDHAERVYYHSDLETDAAGWARASIHNPHFPRSFGAGTLPVTVSLSWDTSTLPGLVQWRMPGAGMHVLGIEPINFNLRGKAASRTDGGVTMMEPGESREFRLRLDVEVAED